MNDQIIFHYKSLPTPHVYLKWGSMVDEQEFREAMDKVIDLMKENGTGKILSNSTQLGALSEEDQVWSVEDWLPRALAIGYSAIAIIVSEDIFGQMAVEDVLNSVSEKSPIKIQYFDNEEKATEWMESLES
jgi:hypothetical protein